MNLINSLLAVPLGYIMKFCYWLVTDILHMPLAYVFALLLFTLITKILMFPLSMQQQKSTAMMARRRNVPLILCDFLLRVTSFHFKPAASIPTPGMISRFIRKAPVTADLTTSARPF